MKTSILRLEWKKREAINGVAERDFLEFVIDGAPLLEKVGGDLISCLGWFLPKENDKAVSQLMLKAESDLADKRYVLYVCPVCGDLSCGAVTIVIDREGDKIVWRDFGFQNDDENQFRPVENIGRFEFDRAQYRTALSEALTS